MSELRQDPITLRWVIIAPEHGRLPQSFVDRVEPPTTSANPFLEGRESFTPPEIWALRAPGTAADTAGWRVRVVPNRFPAVRVEGALGASGQGVYDRLNGIGADEVVIESPEPGLDWPGLPTAQVQAVLNAWTERIRDLRRDVRLRYHLVHRNWGSGAGAPFAHPISQILSLPIIPDRFERELRNSREYFDRKGRSLVGDILDQELASGERVVEISERFAALAPYASRTPFETAVYPRRQVHDFVLHSDEERLELAGLLQRVVARTAMALNSPAYHLQLINAPSTAPRPGHLQTWPTLQVDFRWRIEMVPARRAANALEQATGCYINGVAPEEAAAYLRGVELQGQ